MRRCLRVCEAGMGEVPSSAMNAITYTAVVQSPPTSQQGRAWTGQGGISASGETKFILNQPRQPWSRTMPVNSITSAAATTRASVQVLGRSYRRAPALNIGSTDTDRSEASATQRWAGREDTNREAKQNERRDGNEGGSGRSARRIV